MIGRTGYALIASLVGVACDRSQDGTIQPALPEPTRAPSAPQPLPEAAPTAPQTADAPAPSLAPADATRPRVRSERRGFLVVTRDDCQRGRASYDLLVHFHGVADAVERQWNAARLDGVLAVSNVGTWGRDYKAVYERPGAYAALLDQVHTELAAICPDSPLRAGRVALSGWSAGYAAVRALLRHGGGETVDAVLLSDGLHASLLPDSGTRQVAPEDVAPFIAFGRHALAGTRLFSITHSSIHTPDYASTTETSDYLLHALGLERTSVAGKPETPTVRLISEAERAGFRLRGYSGDSGPEHGWHLHALDRTLFEDLAAWWSRPRSTPLSDR